MGDFNSSLPAHSHCNASPFALPLQAAASALGQHSAAICSHCRPPDAVASLRPQPAVCVRGTDISCRSKSRICMSSSNPTHILSPCAFKPIRNFITCGWILFLMIQMVTCEEEYSESHSSSKQKRKMGETLALEIGCARGTLVRRRLLNGPRCVSPNLLWVLHSLHHLHAAVHRITVLLAQKHDDLVYSSNCRAHHRTNLVAWTQLHDVDPHTNTSLPHGLRKSANGVGLHSAHKHTNNTATAQGHASTKQS